MRAVLLAGGRGRRLAPYTTVLPKPLMPIGDLPIIDILLRQLRHAGVTHVTLAVGYLAELLMAFCGDGSQWDMTIDYSREDEPLGTAGPLSLIDGLEDTFLVANGDLLTSLSFKDLLDEHRKSGADVTLGLNERENRVELGVIETDADGWVTGYIEKPVHRYLASMGIYAFEPSALKHLDRGEHIDLPDFVLRLTKSGAKVFGYRFDGYWLDVGRPDDYERALTDFESNRSQFLPS